MSLADLAYSVYAKECAILETPFNSEEVRRKANVLIHSAVKTTKMSSIERLREIDGDLVIKKLNDKPMRLVALLFQIRDETDATVHIFTNATQTCFFGVHCDGDRRSYTLINPAKKEWIRTCDDVAGFESIQFFVESVEKACGTAQELYLYGVSEKNAIALPRVTATKKTAVEEGDDDDNKNSSPPPKKREAPAASKNAMFNNAFANPSALKKPAVKRRGRPPAAAKRAALTGQDERSSAVEDEEETSRHMTDDK